MTARRLAARRVPVVLIVDALAPAVVAEVDAVVIGADAVTRTAVWSKCGSLGVALAASSLRRPMLVVTTEDRLLPPPLARRVVIPSAEPGAVLTRPPRGVRVINRLFDVTPLHLMAWIVTERGAMRPASMKRRLGSAGLGLARQRCAEGVRQSKSVIPHGIRHGFRDPVH